MDRSAGVAPHHRKDISANSLSRGKLGRREAACQAPPLPRVNCRSSFWAVIWHGALSKWIEQAWATAGLSRDARASKPLQAKSAIANALILADTKPADWCGRFKKVLADAVWYEVRIDQEIDNVLSKMTADQIKAVKNLCGREKPLNWLQVKIDNKLIADKKRMAVENFASDLEIGFCQSAALVCEGYSLGSPVQSIHWHKLDALVMEVCDSNMGGKIGTIISKSSPWALLPFAECYKNGRIDSPTQEEFCRQAFRKIKDLKDIDFNKLTDLELDRFSKLVADRALEHHALGCAAEIEKRECKKKCQQLALHFERQIHLLTGLPDSPQRNSRALAAMDYFNGLTTQEISRIALRVVTSADPDVVVRLAKKKSSDFCESWLIETAKATLEFGPNVKSLSDANLIAFLKLPASELTSKVHSKLKEEAKARAIKGIQSRYEVLERGLDSDSWHGLVSAVKEFDNLISSSKALEMAADLDESQGGIPRDFSEKLQYIDRSKLLRAKRLVDELRGSREKQLIDALIKVFPDRKDVNSVPFNDREERVMREVLSHYFPSSFSARRHGAAQASSDSKLAVKLSEIFQRESYLESLYRKVRTTEGDEIPVCGMFVADQDRSLQEIDGRPVFYEVGDAHSRASDFVRQMRNLKGISDEQIMMASRVAAQKIGGVLEELAITDKLFSLEDGELRTLDVAGISSWAFPAGLLIKANFIMDRKGSLVAKVRIFNENIQHWNAEIQTLNGIISNPIRANPDNSYFSVELAIEIDLGGKIKACTMTEPSFAREVTGFM